jgi:hypothetical protein
VGEWVGGWVAWGGWMSRWRWGGWVGGWVLVQLGLVLCTQKHTQITSRQPEPTCTHAYTHPLQPHLPGLLQVPAHACPHL